MLVAEETKQSKIAELTNLIGQYNAGERENIDADKYSVWVDSLAKLKIADIQETIYEDFLVFPTHYTVDNGEIILNPNWQAEEKEAELKRIANLHITKQDFYNYLCKPAGITYKELLGAVEQVDMQAEWDLCNHVYYGIIRPFLSTLPLGKTEAEVIAVFEKYTKG